MIPDSHLDLLGWDARAFAHMATLGPRAEPQSNPMWFDWDGTHVLISMTKKRQKYRNLHRDKRASLSIMDPSNPYRYIEIRGELVEIEDDPDIDFISRLAKKYLGRDRYPWHRPGDERVKVKILPVKVSGMG